MGIKNRGNQRMTASITIAKLREIQAQEKRIVSNHNHPEDDLQIATADYCRKMIFDGVIFHHSANERHGAKAGAKARNMGQLAGWPDWVFVWSSGGLPKILYVELKSPTGVLSSAQKMFRTKCDAIGVPWIECRSIDEFIATMKRYGVPMRGTR